MVYLCELEAASTDSILITYFLFSIQSSTFPEQLRNYQILKKLAAAYMLIN
jgi:hypothetical protein